VPLYDFRCGEGHLFERMVPLARFAEPQLCECGSATQRLVSAPRLAPTDAIEPIRGADGKMHDSLSGYRRTLEPGGNPKGERYLEIGNEEMPVVTKDFDRKQRRDDIKAGIEDVRNGRVPPPVALEM